MDDTQKSNTNDGEESNNEEINIENNIKGNKKQNEVTSHDVAGPSGSVDLPGLIPHTAKLQKSGLSKSEHSIRQIITPKDVANALKLTSLSFGNQNQTMKNLNLRELNIPILSKNEISEKTDNDTNTFIDLKKFMASCFKFNKDIVLGEVSNLQNVHTPMDGKTTKDSCQANANSSCITSNAQTDSPTAVSIPNEVIVTNAPVETKVSKGDADSNKKKTSGNISERSDFAIAQRDSLSSIGSNVCRICMTRGRERLISPCNCKGSLANVHLTCLERWLNQVGRNHCELCGYSYPAIRTPRYTVLQALRLWFGNPRNRSHLQSDCLIFWLLSTVTAGLLAVCIVGTQYFVIEGNKFGKLGDLGARKEEGISHRITETAMDFFMAIVLCGYSVTVYLLWKDHYVMWNRWRRANVNVRLLLTPDANPVPFTPRRGYSVV